MINRNKKQVQRVIAYKHEGVELPAKVILRTWLDGVEWFYVVFDGGTAWTRETKHYDNSIQTTLF